MLIIHVANNSKNYPNKFVPPYQEMVKKELSNDIEHKFIYIGDSYNTKESALFLQDGYLSAFKVLIWMCKADKVIFHSLPAKRVMLVLSMLISLFDNAYIVLWGGEIYHKGKTSKLREKCLRVLEKIFLYSVDSYITYIKEDVLYLKEHINPSAIQIDLGGFYKGNLVEHSSLSVNHEISSDNAIVNILLGTSALSRNNHLDLIRLIRLQKCNNYIIHVPLSYGDDKYREYIKDHLKKAFPDECLNIIEETMSLEDYNFFLRGIDIAMFGHLGQQGMGNIRQLVANGCEVYCSSESVTYAYLKKLDFRVFSLSDFSLERKKRISRIEHNKNLARSLFSYTESIKEQKIFYSM